MKKKVKNILSIVFGLAIGFINGFFGGGGGMVCVPFLERVLKKPTKVSHATAILIILPISVVSAAVYIFAGNFFDWKSGLPAGGGVLLGGLLGALLLSKMGNVVIRMIFAAVMVAAGVKLLFF